ncbi:MAG: DAK2 domain-containing protein [Candidatus Stahlbacteria bacterium]|nr:DAK2 domain-containing protein [Candidatus Stahlbacteria bacterium]
MSIYYCDGKRLKRGISASVSWLAQNRAAVDALNVFPIPDGDTGTNMVFTLQKVIDGLGTLPTNHLPLIASQIAESSLLGARGSSGVILSQILRGLAEGIGEQKRINSMDLALALRIAAQRAYSAVEKPAEGTILTLIKEIAEAGVIWAKKSKDITLLLSHILEIGEQTLLRTKDMLPELRCANVIDAGGKGFLLMIEGILKLIRGEKFTSTAPATLSKPNIERKKMEERYCLSFIIKGTTTVRKEIELYGKDIVIASMGDITKVHIHTDCTDKILEIAKRYGTVSEVKIEDMQEQHYEFIDKQIAVVVVAAGNGICEIFKRLGTDIVIEGGQTMNPSVEDIVSAIQGVAAEKVILLPNNSNIIPAATGAAKISTKKVHIVPTKTIPEGIAALTAIQPETTIEENMERMSEAIKNVKSGEITQAVRDSKVGESEIIKGNYIGISNHSIVGTSKTKLEMLLLLLKSIVADENSIISIFYNNLDEDVDKLSHNIRNKFNWVDVEFYYGGQPHYDYIVAVE